MISIPFLVCAIALIVWIILSAPREKPHWIKPILAKAAEWIFFWGLAWALYPYVGKVAF